MTVTAGVSADGRTLIVAGASEADSGNQYRATATNSRGSSVSESATLTVTVPNEDTDTDDGDDSNDETDLAASGGPPSVPRRSRVCSRCCWAAG